MIRSLAPIATLALLITVTGCDSKPAADEKTAKKEEPQAEAKEAEPKEEAPAEEAPADEAPADEAKDDTLGIVAIARVAMGKEPVELPKADESSPKHFHVEKDNSGAIGHEATALAHTDAVHSDKLHKEMIKLAHETDDGPTDEKICLHVYEEVLLTEWGDDVDDKEAAKKKFLTDCPHELERERVKLGPVVFAEMATCVMEATDVHGLEFCDMAEAEAEEKLHATPHGDGLDRKTCEAFHDHFAELAIGEMPEDDPEGKKLLEEILADVKEDSVQSCMDHGSKAEVACAMKAKDTIELEACEWGGAPEG